MACDAATEPHEQAFEPQKPRAYNTSNARMTRMPCTDSRGSCDDRCAREFAGQKQADRAVKRRTLGVSEDLAVTQ